MKKHIFMGLTILLAGTFILYWLTPYSGTNAYQGWQLLPWMGQAIRYAFPFIGILGIFSAAGTLKKRMPMMIVTIFVFVSAVFGIYRLEGYFGMIAGGKIYIGISLLLLSGAIAIYYFLRRFFKPSLLLIPVLIAAMFIIAHKKRQINRGTFFGGVQQYIENNLKNDEIIGYFSPYPRYLYYGTSLQNKISCLNRKRKKKFSDWLNIMHEEDIHYIALGPRRAGKLARRTRIWVNKPDTPLIRVFGNNPDRGIVLYRLKGTEK